jgi:hypothetical protein
MTNPYRVRNSTRDLGTWPNREEILALGAELDERYDVDHGDVELVHAALARWGTPAIEPVAPAPTDEELRKEIERKAFSFSDSEVERCSFICGFFAGLPRPTIQPVADGVTDEDLEATARAAEVQNMKEQGGLTSPTPDGISRQLQAQRLAGLRAIAHRYARPTIQPVPPTDEGAG